MADNRYVVPSEIADRQAMDEVKEVETGPFYLNELGTTGLKRSSGYIDEEFLPHLRGRKAVQVYREMGDNSPIIGALLFAITQLIRGLEWTVTPGGKSKDDTKAAKLIETAKDDMEESWDDFMTECLSHLRYGWSWHEIVYKRCMGQWDKDPRHHSKYSDGLVRWRKLPIRSQETLQRWVFDENGGVQAMIQLAPPDYKTRTLPYNRSLLFRFGHTKGNPEGQALAPDTPVWTPDGWRNQGALLPGDMVYDETGRIRHVVDTARWEDRPRYRLTFSDGSTIVADENHQWDTTKVWERSKHVAARTRTTAEISASTKNGNGISNHAISWAHPLQAPMQLLPVHPWYLGLWLGDGTSLTADIACHLQDEQETKELIELHTGYPTKTCVNGWSDNGRLLNVYGGARTALRALGVLSNKHVPEVYLRGSASQRADLLAGLMDADGTVDKDGRCEFVNVNKSLIDAVAHLVRSLGCSARVAVRKNAAEKRQLTWCVKFTPTFVPFKLARKVAKIKPVRARQQHYITDVTKLENGPTVCIEVDAPSHLYLAGTAMIPTHNSILRAAYRPWYYCKRLEEFESIGVERDLAGLPMVKVPAEYLRAKPGSDQYKMVEAMRKMIRSIRRNEQEGLVFPTAYDQDTKQPLFDFELLGGGGQRQHDTNQLIERYENRMLMTVLADFIMVGHQDTGTYNLHVDKTGIFKTALNGVAQNIADVMNKHAIPRLFLANGWKPSELPQLKPADVDAPDLAQLAQFMSATAQIGFTWGPDETMEKWLRNAAGMPALSDTESMKRKQMARQDEAARMAETQTRYLEARSAMIQAVASEQQLAAGGHTPETAQMVGGAVQQGQDTQMQEAQGQQQLQQGDQQLQQGQQDMVVQAQQAQQEAKKPVKKGYFVPKGRK